MKSNQAPLIINPPQGPVSAYWRKRSPACAGRFKSCGMSSMSSRSSSIEPIALQTFSSSGAGNNGQLLYYKHSAPPELGTMANCSTTNIQLLRSWEQWPIALLQTFSSSGAGNNGQLLCYKHSAPPELGTMANCSTTNIQLLRSLEQWPIALLQTFSSSGAENNGQLLYYKHSAPPELSQAASLIRLYPFNSTLAGAPSPSLIFRGRQTIS